MSEHRGARGELAIVLHTHMPYVEGFGTWPFGEEWLWEAIATCYLPLLELLRDDTALTLSLTPVLCDQLEAPDLDQRLCTFLSDVRRETHRRDAAAQRVDGREALALELERSADEYEHALERFRALDGGLLAALASHVQWTSSATHAVLPLLATDAGLRLQVGAGISSHRARFAGGWRGGFWLPECAHASWLEPILVEAGVHATCVDFTDRFGRGAAEHLRPVRTDAGLVLVPIDRDTIELVWSDGGYPAHACYRDYHALTPHHHRVWANDGSPYDPQAASAQVRQDASDFVARVAERLRAAPEGGLVVCALDTELLGHWWYEGMQWLGAVVQEAERQGVALARLDDALARHPPHALADDDAAAVRTWGAGRDLSTWDGPAVADLAWAARDAELRTVAAGRGCDSAAARHLLGLQASDWAFLVTRELAPPYGRERAQGHRQALLRALAGEQLDPALLRNLAVHADPAALLAP